MVNNGEILDLLSVIQMYDGRTVGQSDVHVWADAAERGRWRYVQAREAVKAHYAESTEWLQPGHVTQRIRSQRADPPRSLPEATGPPADREHIDRVTAWLADQLDANRQRHDPAARTRAWTVACPYCGAKPQKPCWQTFHGRPLASGKTMSEPHRDRVRAADKKDP